MAAERTLRITIEVVDEGGEGDYEAIMEALQSIGASIEEEEEV